MDTTTGKSAEELKVLGNNAFAANEFDKAVHHYTQAIKKEPNNHVYYSNRSASYAGLENWNAAIDDAKECIRLEPKFIKGFYRLASAQMSLHEYDAAVQTIRHGLIIEPNNSQLTKQLRLAQQQKKVVAAKQQSAIQQSSSTPLLPTHNTPLDGMALDPATASEYQELQKQYTHLSRDYSTLQADIIKSQREGKVADITCQELSSTSDGNVTNNDDTNKACYRSVGKLFIKTTTNEMIQTLQERKSTEETNVTNNTQQLQYMERQLTSLQQNMNEILQKAQ